MGGGHDEQRRREPLGGPGELFSWDILKYEVPKIAFPAFWEQFPAIFNWFKSLENVTEVALGKQN